MPHLTLRITMQKRVVPILLCLALIPALTAAVAADLPASPAQEVSAPDFMPHGTGRHFYLTDANYNPNMALTACASGYHMASLWEILDVSNLTYDYNHPAAHTKADSGSGPPSYWYGWVRTGYFSSGSTTTGIGNCSAWTSSSNADSGVAVRLSRTWEIAPGDISTWDATSFACTSIGPVWCAGFFSETFIPIVQLK